MALIMSWQFSASPASPRTLAAASIALSFLGLASAFFFAFEVLADVFASSPFSSADVASSALGSAGFPSSGFASLAALLFLAFGAVLVFFALMMHLRNDVSMGWLPSSGGGNHPPRRVSACARRMHQLPRGREDIKN